MHGNEMMDKTGLDFAKLFENIAPIDKPLVIQTLKAHIWEFLAKEAEYPDDTKVRKYGRCFFESAPVVTSEEDVQLIHKLSRLAMSTLLERLEAWPGFCPYFASCITVESFGRIDDYDYYSPFVSFVLYSGNSQFLKFLLSELKVPDKRIFQQIRPSRAIMDMVDHDRMPMFPGGIERKVEGCRKIMRGGASTVHVTACTANNTSLFVGFTNGDIEIYCLPLKGCDAPVVIKSDKLAGLQYSLCWTNEILWAFTEVSGFYVDIKSGSVTALPKNAPKLRFPVTTDGHYLYTVHSGITRFPVVYAFVWLRNCFELKMTLKLDDLLVSKQLMFLVNGTFITFCESTSSGVFSKQFSLATGRLVREKLIKKIDAQPIGWCYSMYTCGSFAIFNDTIWELSGELLLPKWSVGMSMPVLSKEITPLEALYFAVYHELPIYSDGDIRYLKEILKYYMRKSVVEGMIVCSIMIMRQKSDCLIDIFQSSLALSAEDRYLRRFIVFSYMSSLQFTDRRVGLPNLISEIIEEKSDPDFIWNFHSLFDFKRIEFSRLAINRMVPYVCESVTLYPEQALFILRAFLRYVFADLGNRSTMIVGVIPAFHSMLLDKLVASRRARTQNRSNSARAQAAWIVWETLMIETIRHQELWPILSGHMPRLFDIVLHGSDDIEYRRSSLVDITLFVILVIITSGPARGYSGLTMDLDGLYREFPHPLNGKNVELDSYLLRLVKRCYDITTDGKAADMFFRLRNYAFFKTEEEIARLMGFGESMWFRSDLLWDFLNDTHRSHLCSACPSSVTVASFTNANNDSPLMDVTRELIFSMFWSRLKHQENNFFISQPAEELKAFIGKLRYPLLLPPDIIQKSGVQFEAVDFAAYPTDILMACYSNICEAFSTISDPVYLFVPLLSGRERVFCELVRRDFEPVRYHRTLCWCLGFVCGEVVCLQDNVTHIVMYVRTGSVRIISALMTSLEVAERLHSAVPYELHKGLLNLVGEYLYSFERQFLACDSGKEVCDAVFVLINTYRVMYKLKKARDYLVEYLEVDNPTTVLAVLAIINISFDALHVGGNVHLVSGEGVVYDGEVEALSDLSITVDGHEFNIDDCQEIWPVAIHVDLNLLDDFSKFVDLFTTYEPGENHIGAFVEASLNAFLKVDRFFQELPCDFVEKITSRNVSVEHVRGHDICDFISNLSSMVMNYPVFSISRIGNVLEDSWISSSDCTWEGMLLSMNGPREFVTACINPRFYARLEISTNSETSFDILCVCRPPNICLSIDGIVIKSDTVVEFLPQYGTVKWTCDAGVHEAAIPDSCASTNLHFRITNGVVCTVSCSFDETPCVWRALERELCDLHFHPRSMSRVPTKLVSRWYNMSSLAVLSHRIVDWLRQLNKLEICRRTGVSVHNPMHYIFLANQYMYDHALDFQAMRVSPVWGFDADAIVKCVVEQLTDSEELENKCMACVSSSSWSMSKSSCAVMICGDHCGNLTDCLFITSDGIKFANQKMSTLDRNYLVVPMRSTANTSFETVVNIRHMFMIMRMRNERPSDRLIACLRERPIFASSIDLLNILFADAKWPITYPLSLALKRDDMVNWQVMYTAQVHLCEPWNAESFAMLPLSSVFSWEIACFVRDRTDPGSLDCYRTLRRVNTMSLRSILRTCTSTYTSECVTFLRSNDFDLCAELDASLLLLIPAFASSKDALSQFSAKPQALFSTSKCSPVAINMIHVFTESAPLIAILLLIRSATDIPDITSARIFAVSVDDENVIDLRRHESLLAIGTFVDQSSFNRSLLAAINTSLLKILSQHVTINI